MSLRLRLLLSLLALSAVGLVVVDAVSYSSLRSHLSQRVDQQVESARGAATVALAGQPGAKQFRRELRASATGPSIAPLQPGGGGPSPADKLCPASASHLRHCATRAAAAPSPMLGRPMPFSFHRGPMRSSGVRAVEPSAAPTSATEKVDWAFRTCRPSSGLRAGGSGRDLQRRGSRRCRRVSRHRLSSCRDELHGDRRGPARATFTTPSITSR